MTSFSGEESEKTGAGKIFNNAGIEGVGTGGTIENADTDN